MTTRTFMFRICLLMLLAPLLPVQAACGAGSLSLSSAYRVDALDWNIAGTFAGTNPNVLSELTWEDVRSLQLTARAEVLRPYREGVDSVLTGRFSYGWIVAGDNRDSDYAGDNRALEWSRSDNDAGDGHLLDLEGGYGLRFRLRNDRWSLMPNVGYAYYEQDLVMRDGFQTLAVIPAPAPFPNPPPVGPIPGLNSSYYAWWSGPWIGLQAGYRHDGRLRWDVSLRWHKVDFRAEADWNLRGDLQHPVSFEHEADGDGLSLRAGFERRMTENWSLGGDFEYLDFGANDGLDIVYLSSGAVAGTRLNEVNWQSWSVSGTLRYDF